MARKTRRTLRKLPKVSRELAKLGNDLDRISRRVHTLATIVADHEHNSEVLDNFYAKMEGESNG